MACFKVDAFRPLAQFKKDIGEFVQYLKATKPAEGSSGVYYPGEIEHMREEDRRENGIEVEDPPGQAAQLGGRLRPRRPARVHRSQ